MAFTLITPIWFKPPFKSDLAKDVALLNLKLCGKKGSVILTAPLTVRESLLEPGTYIVEPGSFYLRPVKELLEQAQRKKDAKARQLRLQQLRKSCP